ncbi:MAG: putative transport system permease protein [Chloroflexota bacterium]|nr:putative transport system permease protein [Chloroflexota bacterium]
MRIFLRGWAILIVAAKRLVAQRALAEAVILGLVAAVGMAVSLPLYADAVNYRVLQEQLTASTGVTATSRPPFAFMFMYMGGLNGPLEWVDTGPIDDYLRNRAAADLGMPRKVGVRYFATDKLSLYPNNPAAYGGNQKPLEWLNLATASDIEQQITLLEGRFPAPAVPTLDSPIEAIAHEELATKLGLQTGETYILLDRSGALSKGRPIQITLRLTGIWTAADPKSEYWFFQPEALADALLVPEETLRDRISPFYTGEIYLAVWYMVMDGAEVHAESVDGLTGNIARTQQTAVGLLPNLQFSISPMEALQKYQASTSWLSIMLYAFSVPILGMVLVFIGLVAGLAAERQRNETAIFRSRGAAISQVVGITFSEGVILGAVGLGFGLLLGQWIARMMGYARSFLDFSFATQSDLRVSLTVSGLRLGLILLAVALIAQMAPSFNNAKHTIITYKQERARVLRAPWWQRSWLDFLLLIPAGYGTYLLRQQGSIVVPIVGTQLPHDPFQNPLLFLVPALGIFALTLLILRILPPLMSAFAWLISHTRSIGLLLTARHLSRTYSSYTAPLILLVLTLSLSSYTASLAETMDSHTYEQQAYAVGADLMLDEIGAASSTGSGAFDAAPARDSQSGSGSSQSTITEAEWEFLPVSDHLKVPGVTAATRVGRYDATANVGSRGLKGQFIGVDRVDFAPVANWRNDYASSNLGTLMNALALTSNGVLAPSDFLGQNALQVGDRIRVTVQASGHSAAMDMKIVGTFRLFPTWYPDDGPLFVGNLDFLFDSLGQQVPYEVWIKQQAGTPALSIVEGVRELGMKIMTWESAPLRIGRELKRPERQGLFGFLSVGFAAAAFLTVLGFLLYAFFSFRRRFIELGVLRAVGLSVSQMTILLASELAMLILTGVLAGTLLGAAASELFIPFLQVGAGAAARVPPFMVVIAWPTILRIYGLMGLLFVVTLILLGILLLRMRIFQAVKMGETA